MRFFAGFTALFAVVGLSTGSAGLVNAEERYPTRPVRIVVPYPPGGSTDLIARLVAAKMSEAWKQAVIVENRPGATGGVGSSYVAHSEPDGYTVLMGSTSTHSVAPAVNSKLPYDSLRDFIPISLVATFPNVLVVNPALPIKDLKELIALLKSNPGKYSYASTGRGGSVHLATELFKMMTQTDIVHIPYKGSGPALNDLMAGRVQLDIDNMTAVLPYIRAGRLRALGVAGAERSPVLPDVPAIAETLPGYEANSWIGLFGPKGLSETIRQVIAAEARRSVLSRDVAGKLNELGTSPVGNSPNQFTVFLRGDIERWRKVAEAAHITLD